MFKNKRSERALDVLILGASANSLSAARSLGRAGLNVVIAETATDEALKRSRYVKGFLHFEDDDDAAIVSRLMQLPATRDKPFLLATGDRYALLVARHQEQLAARYCFVSPSYAVLDAIIDKAKLYENARQNGFACPAFHVVQESKDIDVAVAKVQTPCYVKPALGHQWRRVKSTKLERAETAADLRRILENFVRMGLIAIPQEIIPGKDSEVFSLSTYIDRSGNCVGYRTKRKLRQWPLDAGNGCAQEVCNQPEVAELGLRILAMTGHRGPATVEFRRDQRSGRFVLIEINARTILAQEMITRSGLDVPLIAYCDAKGKPVPASKAAVAVRWVDFQSDFRAFRQLRRRGRITTWQWLESIASCRAPAYFALGDPAPFLVRTWMWLSGFALGGRPIQ
jgi:predicted ATP-grasp superfamily ATP-dependent carboligase